MDMFLCIHTFCTYLFGMYYILTWVLEIQKLLITFFFKLHISYFTYHEVVVVVVQSLSRVHLFETPWAAACQARLPRPSASPRFAQTLVR